jgi:Haem-degrading
MIFSRWMACCLGAWIQHENGAIHRRLNYRALEAFHASHLVRMRRYFNDEACVVRHYKFAIQQNGKDPMSDKPSLSRVDVRRHTSVPPFLKVEISARCANRALYQVLPAREAAQPERITDEASRYGVATHTTAEFLKTIPAQLALHALSLPEACALQGGVLIKIEGEIVGAVGESGGSGEQDITIAVAAATSINACLLRDLATPPLASEGSARRAVGLDDLGTPRSTGIRSFGNHHTSNQERNSTELRVRYIRRRFQQASKLSMMRMVLLTIIALFTVSAYAQPYHHRRYHHHHHYYRHHHHAVVVVR